MKFHSNLEDGEPDSETCPCTHFLFVVEVTTVQVCRLCPPALSSCTAGAFGIAVDVASPQRTGETKVERGTGLFFKGVKFKLQGKV